MGTVHANDILDMEDWEYEKTYDYGNKVIYNGKVFAAKWWTQGDMPLDEDSFSNPWTLMTKPLDPNNPEPIIGEGYMLMPLSQEKTDLLVQEMENEDGSVKAPTTRLKNVVSCKPVQVASTKIAVRFTNSGVILDFVDKVTTNLLIWNSKSNTVVGYLMVYYKLPHGSWNTNPVTVTYWTKAQTRGGYYVDGFGKEAGIGTISSVLYRK